MQRWAVVVCLALALAETSGAPGIAVVPWQDAGEHVGDIVTVEGDVTARLEGGSCVLEFARDDPSGFRVVLLIPLISDLPRRPERLYDGKRIRATGNIRRFLGRTEMVLRTPEAIEVVDVASGGPAVAAAPPASPPAAAPAAPVATAPRPSAPAAPVATAPPAAPPPPAQPVTTPSPAATPPPAAPPSVVAATPPPAPPTASAPVVAAVGTAPAPGVAAPVPGVAAPVPGVAAPVPGVAAPTAPAAVPPPAPAPATATAALERPEMDEPSPEEPLRILPRVDPCDEAKARWRAAATLATDRADALTDCLRAVTYRCADERAALAPVLSELEWAEQQVDAKCP